MKKTKILLGIIIGVLLSGMIVYAESIISGSLVGYSNSNSKLSATTVQAAIDEVYDKTFIKRKIVAYIYNENKNENNFCINGEEKTCQITECYKKTNTCEVGTIVKYYVNNREYHYFYILHDDGNTITMQQRENTIRSIPWHADGEDNTKGPDTILTALEQATSTWTNANILEYEPGVTPIQEESYANCQRKDNLTITCNNDPYSASVLSSRKVYARMITVKEANDTGCLEWRNGADQVIVGNSFDSYNHGSCPDWMHSYMFNSGGNGGSYEDNTLDSNGLVDYGYWTMSTVSGSTTNAWLVTSTGTIDAYINTVYKNAGARAVIEITKP